MRKSIKKISKLFSYLVMFLITLPVLSWGIIQIPAVQDYAVSKVIAWISAKVGTEIRYSKIRMVNINRFRIQDFLIYDQQGDTLIFAGKAVAVTPILYQLIRNESAGSTVFRRLDFEKCYFNLVVDTSGRTNLQFIIDYLKSGQDSTQVSSKRVNRIRNIRMDNSRFALRNSSGKRDTLGINFSEMEINNMSFRIKQLLICGDTVEMAIKSLEFTEQSGFRVNKLNTDFSLCSSYIKFENTHILTDSSMVEADFIKMSFHKYNDFSGQKLFKNVFFEFDVNESNVNLSDVGYFADIFYNYHQSVFVSGSVKGALSNLKGKDLALKWGTSSYLIGNFDINGLPKVKETFLIFDLKELKTSYKDITMLTLPGNRKIETYGLLAKLDELVYRGNFTGFFNDFVAHGKLNTNLGEVYTDLMLVPDSANLLSFSGMIRTQKFALGTLLDKKELLKDISMDVEITGSFSKSTPFSATIKGDVAYLDFYDYHYQNIMVNGSLSDKRYNGLLEIHDPNLNMEFEGLIDISVDPWLYDFRANIIDANLYALNISKSDPNYHASFLIEANATGKSLDELNGEVRLLNSFFSKTDKQIQVYDLSLTAHNTEVSNEIIIRSDILDADLTGRFHMRELKNNFLQYLSSYLPALVKEYDQHGSIDKNILMNFKIALKRTNSIFDFFFPEYLLSENTLIAGIFCPENDTPFAMSLYSPKMEVRGSSFTDMIMDVKSDQTHIMLDASAKTFNINKGMGLENFALKLETREDHVYFSSLWHNVDSVLNEGNISGNLLVEKPDSFPSFSLFIEPSIITFNNNPWNISDCNITFKRSGIKVDSMKMEHTGEYILVDGNLTDIPGDSLYLNFNDFDISNLNYFTDVKKFDISGKLNGWGNMTGLKKNKLFFSYLVVRDLQINKEELGLFKVSSLWDDNQQSLNINASMERGNLSTLKITGDYYPTQNKKMDFNITLDKLKTDLFNPIFAGVFSDIQGIVSGNLKLVGIAGHPSLSGKLKFQKNAMTVNYLKTRYNFTSDIEIVNNNFVLNNVEVFDPDGNSALVNGIIRTNEFKEINFNINIDADNLLFLNTKSSDNEMFYGTAYGTGIIKIKGMPSNMEFDIDASTGKNTRFYIPLSGASELTEYNYISFVGKDTIKIETTEENSKHIRGVPGIMMDFNLNVTPDAEVQIIFDPKMGDIIKARGSGIMHLTLNNTGTFEMVGEYTIERGDYLFTLQDVINKKLKIEPGSTLKWMGDPVNARIDVTAVYRTKASLIDLFPYETDDKQLMNRATVDCYIYLTGDLLSPKIRYDLNLPYTEETTRDRVKSKISSEENLTKQILYLLVMNRFYSENPGEVNQTGGNRNSSNIAGVNASELLSNQLSNWLSQINNEVNVGVNYRPESELNSREVEVALSTQLLNDRLSVNGSLDMKKKATTENTNNIVGDLDVDYKLNKSGNVRLRAFNHSNDNQREDFSSNSTQGVGVYYMEEFNTFDELINRYWAYLNGKKKKKPDEVETDGN